MNSKDGIDFAMLLTRRERRRTSDSALSRVRSKVLRLRPRRLDSEALRRLQRWGKPFRLPCQGWEYLLYEIFHHNLKPQHIDFQLK